MKRLISMAGSFALIMAAVFCTLGSVTSAFSFSVDMGAVFWSLLCAALILSALATFLRGKGILLAAPFAAALIVWKLPEVISGAKWAAFFISNEYNKWIEVPVFFQGTEFDAQALTLFFIAAGLFLAFLITPAICLRRSAILTIVFTLPVVFLTFVLTNYQPFRWYLIELLAVYLTLIISNSLHPDDYHKRDTAVFPALALAVLLLGTTFLLTSTGANRRSELIGFFDSRLRGIAERTGFSRYNFGLGWPDAAPEFWRFNTEVVRISDAGPRRIADKELLEIRSTQAGSYYLRGYSMQFFDGSEWYINADSQRNSEEWWSRAATADIIALYSDSFPDMAPPDVHMEIIRTGDASGLSYLPYYTHHTYTSSSYQFGGNAYADSTPYYADFYTPRVSVMGLLSALPPDVIETDLATDTDHVRQMAIRIMSTYTKIDDDTAEGLRRLALDAGIDPGAGRATVADKVAAYISSSARYTLSPYPIPDGEDFALYFLQTLQQGYCIHFATAATLMLRSLGIPARFTSGFVVMVPNGEAGNTVVVTDRSAHAWVEVFYDDVGWVPLEVTPAGAGIPVGVSHASTVGAGRPDETLENEPQDWQSDFYQGSTPRQPSDPGSAAGTQEQAAPTRRIGAAPLIIIGAAILVLLIILRQFAYRKRREKSFAQADANAAVIAMWRYIARLSRKTMPPDRIEEIALKARFSQHRVSGAERAEVLNYALSLSAALYKKYYLPGRLWLKYILLA